MSCDDAFRELPGPPALTADDEVGASKGKPANAEPIGALPIISLIVAGLSLAITISIASDKMFCQPSFGFDHDAEVEALRREIEQQRSYLDRVVKDVASSMPSKFAILDTSDRRYERAEARAGFFLLRCHEVRPYLDGFRVTLDIGNALLTSYDGFKLTVHWGPPFPYGSHDVNDVYRWNASIRTQEIRLADTLLAGKWSRVQFALPRTTADQIRELRVAIETEANSPMSPADLPPR
jgi:hypothetical protein